MFFCNCLLIISCTHWRLSLWQIVIYLQFQTQQCKKFYVFVEMVCTHCLQFHVKGQHPTTDYITLMLLGFWISSLYCIQKRIPSRTSFASVCRRHLLSLVQQNELLLLMGIICLLTILVSAPIIGFCQWGKAKTVQWELQNYMYPVISNKTRS